MTELKKISEWLSELDSHGIYDDAACRQDFIDSTGRRPLWPRHSPERTRAAIRARGLGGDLNARPAAKLAYGWEIAEALAYDHADGFRSLAMGRGTIYNHCLDALKAKGL